MNTEVGCGFCQRSKGLPVFLARPAIMEKSDGLPRLHYRHYANLPVGDAGGARYTARILREGFLYVYYEKSNQWETYTISSKGHYYLHSEEGSSPQCLNSEKKTVCMNNGSKVARASFITLYIMPEEKENGIVWFAWTDAPWSEEMKKQHEDKEHRIKNMQSFNVDVWLTSGTHENVDFLSELKNTVAEYNEKFVHTILKRELPPPKTSYDLIKTSSDQSSDYYYFKTDIEDKTDNIINEANQLYANKGAILFLSDPVGVVRDISFLCNYLVHDKFPGNAKYARGIALSAMLSGLKDAVCEQYRIDCEEKDKEGEIGYLINAGSRGGNLNKYNIDVYGKYEEIKDKNISSMDDRVKNFWDEKYEKYIDREKERFFLDEYNDDFNSYIEKIVSPMVSMHLKWLDSDVLKNKFQYNYNKKNDACSSLYVQSVNDCVYGMTDKKEIVDYIFNKLKKSKVSEDNFILRAMFRNNDVIINKVNEAVNGAVSYAGLPWNKIFDGVTDTISKFVDVIDELEIYLHNIMSILIKVVKMGINISPIPSIISLPLSSKQAVVVVAYKGKYKHYLKALVKETSMLLDMNNKRGRDRLYEPMDRFIRKMKLSDIKMEQYGEMKFFSILDPGEAKKLTSLTEEETIKQLSKLFLSEEEFRKDVFNQQYRSKIAPANEKYSDKIKNTQTHYKSEPIMNRLKNGQLMGCTASLIFQIYALGETCKELTKNIENGTKFVANVVGAIGTSADYIDRKYFQVKNQRLVVKLRGERQVLLYSQKLQFVTKVCSIAAVISATWDFFHLYEESGKENKNHGLMTAYGLSGASTLALVGALLVSASTSSFVASSIVLMALTGPVAIMLYTAILFGSAIYIALEKRDDIQEWLLACDWRKIPEGEEGIPPKWATKEQEKEAFIGLM